ncbi:TRAFAC clade GTPase domain-containing protein [Herbiconiux sp. SYSU D00978]|uniref:TRAFAC clade GTPase domain-containing protein n=1 Tax=Herbiconiux sp. SYSU D00978 TaxID=2812562 RepID=UPI001A978A96|nr:ATP/GTP-binding protein [Herbiconiux sp. SYSU D00978]
MRKSRKLEQHIAVFGESGSGKTVMVSSFYGATQEQAYKRDALFDVVADSQAQGRFLHQNYLGMRGSARLPIATRFASDSYAFSMNLKNEGKQRERRRAFDALRLVWHDYPGEWFEQDLDGAEAIRRVETFRNLLRSDVALLLIDGQRLLDNTGEEERYLKALLTSISNGLRLVKDEVLTGGRRLVQFPRIWVFALSKCDLLPDVDVFRFRDILVEKASNEIDRLQEVLSEFVESSEALSVGEDFVLLSSAKFDGGKIEVTERVGLNLVLPIAAMLPFERHVRWARAMQGGGKVFEHLIRGAGAMAAAAGGIGALAVKLSQGDNKLLTSLGLILTHFGSALEDAAEMGAEKLKRANEDALAKKETLRAVLTGFQLSLIQGESERILLRGSR